MTKKQNSKAVRAFGLLTALAAIPILIYYTGWYDLSPIWAVVGHLLQAVGILGMAYAQKRENQEN